MYSSSFYGQRPDFRHNRVDKSIAAQLVIALIHGLDAVQGIFADAALAHEIIMGLDYLIAHGIPLSLLQDRVGNLDVFEALGYVPPKPADNGGQRGNKQWGDDLAPRDPHRLHPRDNQHLPGPDDPRLGDVVGCGDIPPGYAQFAANPGQAIAGYHRIGCGQFLGFISL